MDSAALPRFDIAYVGVVAYVGVASVRATHATTESIVAAVALPLLVLAATRVGSATATNDPVGPTARECFKLVATGTALHLSARSAGSGRLGFDAAALAGVALAAIATLVALARVPQTPGLVRCPPSARSLDAALLSLLFAIVGVTIPAAAALIPERRAVTDPLTIDYATTATSAALLVLLTLASLRFRLVRRLELGVVERGSAALGATSLMLVVASISSVLDLAPHDRIFPASVLLATAGTIVALLTRDASLVSALLRTGSAAAILGVPIALFAAVVVSSAPKLAGGTTLLSSVILIIVGVLAPRLARRLAPSSARWLEALEVAHQRAILPDPGAALQATLGAIRYGLGAASASPLLLRTETGHVLSVDRAGYLHEAPGTPPVDAARFCEQEPGHTLRLEVARSLEIRDPQIRPVLAWMEAHAIACVTTLRDESGVIGMLAMPHRGVGSARRRALLTLDEVLALDHLAERLASVLSFTSSAAIARARAESADAALEAANARIDTLLALEKASADRHRETSLRLARDAGLASSTYSPAARLAEADLVRALSGDLHVVVLAPPGTEAVAWIAMAHDNSPYAQSTLVVVRASDAREHASSRWTDPTKGHFAFASNGSLVVLDPHALPNDTQRVLAQHIASRGPGVARVIVVLRETVDALAARGRIVEELADALGGRLIAIPGLATRTEDIRPISLDHLARLGTSLLGAPLGLSDDALALLLDHAWPGNEQELANVLLLAIQGATPPNITAKDLKRAGFSPVEPRTIRPRSEPPHRRHVS